MRGKSVFYHYFLSYLIILGLSILISVMVYFYSFRIINDQSARLNEAMLETLRVEVDGRLGEIHKLLGAIILDANVQKAVAVKNTFSIADREMLYDIQMNFLGKSASINFLHDIFIYFNNTNSVLSLNGHMTSELFYDLYCAKGSVAYEDLLKMLKRYWYWGDCLELNYAGEETVFFLQAALPYGKATSSAVIGVNMRVSELNNWLIDMKWDDSLEIFVLDSNGLFIGNTEWKERIESASDEKIWEQEYMKLQGQNYLISSLPSSEMNWHYVVLTPNKMAQKTARSIQVITWIGLFVAVSTGIGVSYLLTRLNYNPLKNMLSIFLMHQPKREEKIGNEYQYLLEQMNQFFKDHQEVQKRASNSERILNNQYLYRLVTQPYDLKLGDGEFNDRNTSLTAEWNIVLLVSVFAIGKGVPEPEPELSASLSKFVVINIFEEMIREQYNIEHADLGDTIAFIINTPESGHEMREQIEMIWDHTQHWMKEKFFLNAHVFAGDFRRELEGIHGSYLNAREAYEYQNIIEQQLILWYDDIKDQHMVYEYSLEMEQKILNALKAGDEKNALQWIFSVLQNNYENRALTYSMKKCLLLDLIGTVLKAANQCGYSGIPGDELERYFSASISLSELKEHFTEILTGMGESIRKKEQDRRDDKQFGNKVIQYVKENYQNPDLNISQAALHFNITPSYLSAVFKEQTGFSLLEYINGVRIEKAKELLLQESYSVTEIASMTGFRNSGALIRVFKKLTGITPGQMKRMGE